MSSSESKARGTAAYKASRFEDAVKYFTEAIETATTEAELETLPALYSNRSAAFQQLKDFKSGAESAEACTQAKPTWAKGYSHLGLCKYQLGEYDDAVTAYNKAAELDPSKAPEYHKGRALAQRAKQAGGAAAHTRPPYAAGARPARPGMPPPTALSSRTGRLLAMVHLGTHALVVLAAGRMMAALLLGGGGGGGGGAAANPARPMALAALASVALAVARTYGWPKLNQELLLQVVQDRNVLRVFPAGLLLLGPNLPVAACVLMPEIANAASTAVASLSAYGLTKPANALRKSLSGLGVLEPMGGVSYRVANTTAIAEVVTLVSLVVGLFALRGANLLLLLLWGQYLQMRYMIETGTGQGSGVGSLHLAFAALNGRLTALTEGRFCPSLVRRGYGLVQRLASRQVALPDPNKPTAAQSAAKSLAGKCTIM